MKIKIACPGFTSGKMKNFTYRLLIACLAIFTLAQCKSDPKNHTQGSVLPRGQDNHLDRFEQEIMAFEAADKKKMPPKGALLFTGSSSIRLWDSLASDFAPMPVINRGFGGSTIAEVNYYMDRIVLKYDPGLIVLYCGENDITDDQPPAVVFQEFKKFIGETEKNLSGVPVVYISAKPSPARWKNWRKFQTLNGMIQTFAEARPNLYYVDISPTLLGPNDQPDPSLFVEDQLHLNRKGYEKWTAVLRPVVEGLYEEKAAQ